MYVGRSRDDTIRTSNSSYKAVLYSGLGFKLAGRTSVLRSMFKKVQFGLAQSLSVCVSHGAKS